jgi:hypothetical protein
MYRLKEWENGELRVVGKDLLGNRSLERVWNLRTAQPARVTGWRVGGRDPTVDSIAVRIKEVTVALDSEGDGDMVVTVEDPARQTILSTLPWRRFQSNQGVFSVSLGVEAGQDQDRLLSVRNLDGSTVDQVSVRVDRMPPTLRIPGLDSSGILMLPSNQSTWQVMSQDLRTPPELSASGSIILKQIEVNSSTREFTLAAPDSLPARVHLEARDAAGNRTVLSVLVRRP